VVESKSRERAREGGMGGSGGGGDTDTESTHDLTTEEAPHALQGEQSARVGDTR